MTTEPQFKETVFEDSYLSFINQVRSEGICTIDDISKLVKIMQSNEMDCHIVWAGQNGTGKSMGNLMFCKKQDPKHFLDNYFLPDKTSDDLISFYIMNENKCVGIDELNQYLYYKEHASNDQNQLIKTMEQARSKCIVTSGCIRDPRKLTLNYRDGKMSILIWVLDRYKDKSGSYGVVLVGNPVLEGEDRFGIEWLRIEEFDFEKMRGQIENLPSFIGYMKIPSVTEVLSKEELSRYKANKNRAMCFSHLYACIKKFKAKKMDSYDFNKQMELLRSQLGKDIVDSRIADILESKQKGIQDFIEDD